MDTIINLIQTIGFPMAVVVWLLYDRLQRDKYIVIGMNGIVNTLDKIEMRLMENK